MMDNITEFEKRKQDMKELWKETFHDTDRYVDLVFDTYFSLENTFVRYHENRLIAAMLTIAYEFQILTKEGKREHIRGMYLCGLATHPDWRRRGIMSELMKDAEEAAKARGFAISFLIPADNHLREYYGRNGYRTASWRIPKIYRYEGEKSGESTMDMNIYSIHDFLQNGKVEFVHELADWCRMHELSRRNSTIVHSLQDMLAVMEENENSFFITRDTFDPEYPILANVVAVVFPELSERPEDTMRVVGLYIDTNNSYRGHQEKCHDLSYYNLALEICKHIFLRFEIVEIQIMEPVAPYGYEENGTVPYAMIKPIDQNAKFLKNENPTIEISLMLD